MQVPYSADKDDLYFPAKRAIFFPAGRSKSDAALCVEMSRLAYCQLDTSFALDQARIRKVLGAIGFTDCKFFESPTDAHGGGSHGFLAIDGTKKLGVLSFRGTNAGDPFDLMDDFNAAPETWNPGGKVHSGFAGALHALWDAANQALAAIPGYRLLFTGHSLGAAMATLASSLQPPASLYTFGSPRVGDSTFVKSLQGLDNHRYVDCCDLVARVPPEGMLGYTHLPGNIFYIDLNRKVAQMDPGDPNISADQSRAEAEYLADYAWRIGDVALRPLADHAPVNYVLPVTAATP
jgi:hypothetical protein